MTPAHRRYIAIEASIGAAISGALSVAFWFLIFGGLARVPAIGLHGLVLDALPQSFMIALMASLVPTLLTRGRVRPALSVDASALRGFRATSRCARSSWRWLSR